ncbi:hypothetical protein LPAF129_09750 [Ligilactobacillus pabuli]|uniref:Uncharacterized protein n=1 Tax=Ligilactobacillus pabuli TaxID=2886039 RepID=A0ABQ5JH25_9LACO|nr:hypothetical protein LPAF129_09750 [Ligilactobacillus pabuli]
MEHINKTAVLPLFFERSALVTRKIDIKVSDIASGSVYSINAGKKSGAKEQHKRIYNILLCLFFSIKYPQTAAISIIKKEKRFNAVVVLLNFKIEHNLIIQEKIIVDPTLLGAKEK